MFLLHSSHEATLSRPRRGGRAPGAAAGEPGGLAGRALWAPALRQVAAPARGPAGGAVHLLRGRRAGGAAPAREPGGGDRAPRARVRPGDLSGLGGAPLPLLERGRSRNRAGPGRAPGPGRRGPRAAEPAAEADRPLPRAAYPPPSRRL